MWDLLSACDSDFTAGVPIGASVWEINPGEASLKTKPRPSEEAKSEQ